MTASSFLNHTSPVSGKTSEKNDVCINVAGGSCSRSCRYGMSEASIPIQKGIATPTELARHTGLTSGATTAMLDRLEKAGLIERRPNPHDRRGSLIAPEKLSAEKMASWFASARKAQDDLISSYSESELEIIADVFERFARLWDQEREKLQRSQ